MGHVEDEGHRLRRRFHDHEGRVELIDREGRIGTLVLLDFPQSSVTVSLRQAPHSVHGYIVAGKRDALSRVIYPDGLMKAYDTLRRFGAWRPMKILLAEDDNDMRRFLVKALQNAGYDVASFDNGLSAYNRLREEPFELLLTDIVMPEMDGIELARRATELDPEIKVMFITGFAAVALNPDFQAPRDAKVLSKPFHLRDLVTKSRK